jgi:retron-type reverse transcriptase
VQFALTVPTVTDRVAQTVVKLIIEPNLDTIFHPDSYGYRPGRSAKQAVAITRERCWRYDWVVEFDIKAAFDQIDHGLLMKAVRAHIKENWILLYIERWLIAPPRRSVKFPHVWSPQNPPGNDRRLSGP